MAERRTYSLTYRNAYCASLNPDQSCGPLAMLTFAEHPGEFSVSGGAWEMALYVDGGSFGRHVEAGHLFRTLADLGNSASLTTVRRVLRESGFTEYEQ